jgi:D-apiose dehydrogenase
MDPLRIAVIGCGFCSQFQIPAWRELRNVECVAVCDTEPERAKAAADRFCVPKHFRDPEDLFQTVHPDVVDVITGPETHRDLVERAVRHRIPVICQKPLAPDFKTAHHPVVGSSYQGIAREHPPEKAEHVAPKADRRIVAQNDDFFVRAWERFPVGEWSLPSPQNQ